MGKGLLTTFLIYGLAGLALAELPKHSSAPTKTSSRGELFEPPQVPPLQVQDVQNIVRHLENGQLAPGEAVEIASTLTTLILQGKGTELINEVSEESSGEDFRPVLIELSRIALEKSLSAEEMGQARNVLGVLDQLSLKLPNTQTLSDVKTLIQKARELIPLDGAVDEFRDSRKLLLEGKIFKSLGKAALALPKEAYADVKNLVQDEEAMHALLRTLNKINEGANQSPSQPVVAASLEALKIIYDTSRLAPEERRAQLSVVLRQLLPSLVQAGLEPTMAQKIELGLRLMPTSYRGR